MLAGTLTLSACLDVAQPVDMPTDPATEVFASNLGIDISQMTKTANGDYYRDLDVGTGAALTASGTVIMSYAAYLKDGTIFGEEESVQVDMRNTPLGLQDAMIGMHEGGERIIVIPSEFGYGAAGTTGVPPNSTLVFDVRLLTIG